MTIDRDGSRLGTTSPVHVHVEDDTPVHVYVKKPKKPVLSESALRVEERLRESKRKAASQFEVGNLRRSTASVKSKSKGAAGSSSGPWIPAPGKTSKTDRISWIGPSHRLDIADPKLRDNAAQSTLHLSDLSTDEEDRVQGSMMQYEKKIGSLMTEVGSLKNEVDLQKSLRDIERKEEQLEASRMALLDQENELCDYKRELTYTDKENRVLRRNLDRLHDEYSFTRSEREVMGLEREQLMKKLVEVEMDGQAAAKQVAALRDTIRRLRQESRLSSSDSAMLAKQKELLMERMADFEGTNRTLRRMLREAHKEESGSLRLTEQRDVLLRKLSENDDLVKHQKLQVLEKEREIQDLQLQINRQRDENMAVTNLQESLESNKAHLQKQLRQKEGDCNRMAVQIRSLESQLASDRIEMDHLQGILTNTQEKAERDKEALKKATRIQKQRAMRGEDSIEQLNAQLLEKETFNADLQKKLDDMQIHADKVSKEKSQVIAENTALQGRIAELETTYQMAEDNSKVQIEETSARLHNKTAECSSLKLENERLKTSQATMEDKLSQAESEVIQLQTTVRQYEVMLSEYKNQAAKNRREAEEVSIRLDEASRETSRIQREGEMELDHVRCRLQERLLELEPLPELLRTTELRLQDANEKILLTEQRNTDQIKLIAELTAKSDHQSETLDGLREKWHASQDETRMLQNRLVDVERKMRDIEDQNRDVVGNLAKREELLHQSNVCLDEKTRECASLNRQLEAALTDGRRASDQARDKLASKDRAAQSKVLELESQLSQIRAEVARARREKEETERKFNSRLYDLKDRLEQSHSTNRSMQNYVQFLKNSYANVFGETAPLTSSPLRSSLH